MKMEWEGWCVSRTITDGRTDADTDVVPERVSRHLAWGRNCYSMGNIDGEQVNNVCLCSLTHKLMAE